jgi:NDP-sugar pyrophosphorylase family protein
MKIKHALIMAAGRGQRMMPLTNGIPKAMVLHEGTTLIAKGIERLKTSVEFIHITVGYKGAILAKHVIEHRVSSIFNTDGKGNAWWIFNTMMKHLNEPVLVLTCDNICELDSDLLIRDYHYKNDPACMVVPVKPVKGLEGDYIFQKDGSVSEINRNKPSDIYCSGIQMINPHRVNQLVRPTEDFGQVWKQLIDIHQLYCSGIYPKRWFAVDTLDHLDQLNRQSAS